MIYKKYYLYKEQVSLDNGVTWEDVTPAVTAPSGDPIASYSTLEECEGITSCTCADFTYSPTAFTVSSAATSVTFSYTGCTKPDLTSAATYNWIAIGNHTYDTGSTTGSVIANVSANTSSSRTATLNLSLSGTTCRSLTISQESGEEPQPTCDCDSFAFSGTEEVDTNYITVKVKNNTGNAIYVDHVELYYANGDYDDEHDFGSVECDGSSATTTLTDEFNVMAGLPQTVTGATIEVCHQPQCSSPSPETVTFNPSTLTNEGDIITLTFNG